MGISVSNCIDYNKQYVFQKVMEFSGKQGVDLIVDLISSENWKTSYKYLSPLGKFILFDDQNFVKGRFISLFSTLKEVFSMPNYKPLDLMSENKSIIGYRLGQLAYVEDKILRSVVTLSQIVYKNNIRSVIDRVFPFIDACETHSYKQDQKKSERYC